MIWQAKTTLWPYLAILLAASFPTMIWRWIGVFLVGGLNEDSEWIALVRCISTAMVAAVVAQFIFSPNGALAEIPVVLRVGAAVVGFSIYLIKNNLFLSILLAEVVLLGGAAVAGAL